MKTYIIDGLDSVAVALENISIGDIISVNASSSIVAKEEINSGHKIAIKDIEKGQEVFKYGFPIGKAKYNISAGEWVHTHNLESMTNQNKEYTYDFDNKNVVMPDTEKGTFMGYKRMSGEVGIRNYIAVMSGVFCANPHIKRIADMANNKFPHTENFDGFMPLTHECGCGQEGQDIENVKSIIADLLKNPNFGGILFIEVGCEITRLDTIINRIDGIDKSRIKTMVMQEVSDEFEIAMETAEILYEAVIKDIRQECGLSTLHIGLNCGGSDGFSGLTSNRIVGMLAEYYTKHGATVTITEVTEMFGAEQILMNRAIDYSTFEKIKELIYRHRNYMLKYNASPDNNPSYGNKQGGISTIEDKSLGCIQKGGKCAITDVVFYGERTNKKGFNLVQGPGSDLIGVTSQIAAGAVLEIFTTGRGTPVSFAVPTLKVSSNSRIYNNKQGWIDYNAGCLLDGEEADTVLNNLIHLVSDTISGKYRTINEKNQFYEIGIQRDGVIM